MGEAIWKFVPVEPDEAMTQAAIWALDRARERDGKLQDPRPYSAAEKHAIRFRAMVDAVPTSPDDKMRQQLLSLGEKISAMEGAQSARIAELLEANNRYLAEAREARAEVAQMRETAKGAAIVVSVAGSVMSERAAEIQRLQPFESELRKIAADLGEPEDPFAAWEVLQSLKNDAAAVTERIEQWAKGECIPEDEAQEVLALLKGIAADDVERCLACGEPLLDDDMVHDNYEGGTLHDECAGQSTEGFVNMEDGAPLGAGEPRPAPWRWGDRLMPKTCADEPLPKPFRNDGGEPCGECHLMSGEVCDICGASALASKES